MYLTLANCPFCLRILGCSGKKPPGPSTTGENGPAMEPHCNKKKLLFYVNDKTLSFIIISLHHVVILFNKRHGPFYEGYERFQKWLTFQQTLISEENLY